MVRSVALVTLLSACSSPVEGVLIHDEDAAFSLQGPFTPGDGAHAVVRVSQVPLEDASAEVLLERELAPIEGFPMDFSIDDDGALPGEVELMIEVEVMAGDWAEAQVGDLVNEDWTTFRRGDRVKVVLTALESCDDPDAGGFCI